MTRPAPTSSLADEAGRVAYRQRLDVFVTSRDSSTPSPGKCCRRERTPGRVVNLAARQRVCRPGQGDRCRGAVTHPEVLHLVHRVHDVFSGCHRSDRKSHPEFRRAVGRRPFARLIDDSIPCPFLENRSWVGDLRSRVYHTARDISPSTGTSNSFAIDNFQQ
jgi:hypothetical protein